MKRKNTERETDLPNLKAFIVSTPPFERLPNDIIDRIIEKLSIHTISAGNTLPHDKATESSLYIIRSGAVSLLSENGNLLGKLITGDVCTIFCIEGSNHSFRVSVDEESTVYSIACEQLSTIVADHPSVLSYIHKTASQRFKEVINSRQQLSASLSTSLAHVNITSIMHHPVFNISSERSIREAAKIMTENKVSALMIMAGEKPIGILTDKDISKRCVAAEIDPTHTVDAIMTRELVSVNSQTSAYDALMIMTRKHIHHLPVIDNEHLSGILTITDLMRQEGRNAAYLTSAISRAKTIDELKEHSSIIPRLQVQMVNRGATPDHVGTSITAITSALTRRLINMAEAQLGPAPVPYAWVAAGSQARREQTSHTDQDNGLVMDDSMTEKDEAWFEALARFVCDGLDACGYIYCPGNVMAMNPKWRQTASVWNSYFTDWITQPEPKALMYSSIFFDLRTIHGDESLLKGIRTRMLELTQKNTLFLAHMSFNALKLRPPLGFFKDFVLVHDGEHDDTLDLKHNGIAPIVDLARIYALAEGIEPVNTIERLKRAAGTPSLSAEGGANLLDAFEFINTLRIEHQANQIKKGLKADNYMAPVEISKLQREYLKDAFKVIQTMQSSLENRY